MAEHESEDWAIVSERELWARVHDRAMIEGLSPTQVIDSLLLAYLNGKIDSQGNLIDSEPLGGVLVTAVEREPFEVVRDALRRRAEREGQSLPSSSPT